MRKPRSFPPENKLAACLEVLYWATIRLRMIGYAGATSGLSPAEVAEVAAITDAVHEIPQLMQRWESCDEDLLRGMLGECDEQYPSSQGLLEIYDRVSDLMS